MKQKEITQPIYLGFASQKGGVGKSTLAEILASILYYEKGIHLLVIDCDGTQESFFKLRERDRALANEDPLIAEKLKEHFTQFGKPAYQIIRSSPEIAIKEAAQQIHLNQQQQEDTAYRLVIFDFPGHAGTKKLLELSIEMDYIVSPIEPDPQSLVSSLAYATTIRDLGIGFSDARIENLFLLWNKVDRRANNALIELYSNYIKEQDLALFNAYIYSTIKFSRELEQGGIKGFFRCSYLPPSPMLRSSTGIDAWIEELLSAIKLKGK